MENRCVVCGAIIPEGRQICPACEAGKQPVKETSMKMLRISGASLRIEMRDGETQEQAEDRLLDTMEEHGITCYAWNGSEVEDE